MTIRFVDYSIISDSVRQLCIDSCYELGEDVYDAISVATNDETSTTAKSILLKLLENADIAKNEHIPICQDTGLAVVFVEQGARVVVEPSSNNHNETIVDAINEGVERGYKDGLLRKSVVVEPLFGRLNTKTNTPAIIHHSIVPGDKIKITVISKGGGCENKSQFKMFNPTSLPQEIAQWVCKVAVEAGANACPPFVIGVGIGGDFELSALLSKKALIRPIDDSNPSADYAKLEKEILALINSSGVGPQGFGGNTTALAVKVEYAPCHIASLPVSVNIECHAHRHKSIVI